MKKEEWHCKSCLAKIPKPKNNYFLNFYCSKCSKAIQAHKKLF